MLQQESKRRLTGRQIAPTRHNRFGGSYSIEVMVCWSDMYEEGENEAVWH